MLVVVPIGGSGGGTKEGTPGSVALFILFSSITFAHLIPDFDFFFLFFI